VGAARARALAAAGIESVRDLLLHLPLRFVEHPEAVALADQPLIEGPVAVIGRLERLQQRSPRRRLTLVSGELVDGPRRLPVVWFNQPWRARLGPGPWVARGELRRNDFGWQLQSPELLEPRPGVGAAAAAPVYPALAGLPPAVLAAMIEAALVAAQGLEDPLPAELRERRGLPPLGAALSALHQQAGATPARQRLVWGELLQHQLLVLARRARRRARAKGHHYRIDDRLRAVAREILPFALTAGQKLALAEIVADLREPGPMARLLHGEVGSGKTVVAALAMLIAAESGLQSALLVPTEVLAEQHAAALERLFGGRHRVALVTADRRDEPARRGLERGDVAVAVGTHALLGEGVAFARLALVVVDEMHRFGVAQRAALHAKGRRPDLLLMSATPIPRSLALSAFGDLDASVLAELPGGRAGIETAVLPAGRRPALERRLCEVLDAGERVFVVLPRIEANDDAVPTLEREGRRWLEALGAERSRLVHGRLSSSEVRSALAALRTGGAQALVATSVIEVGIDVPEATWMVIDGAEHFGLAQLHQLRGRVGRGDKPGRCVALHGDIGEAARARLDAFAATMDGFALADADLIQRGPGELLGQRQAGSAALRFADPLRDRELLAWAHEDAATLLASPQATDWVAAARAGALAFGSTASEDKGRRD
jgi:ATP-dependent DNA helicase RecG